MCYKVRLRTKKAFEIEIEPARTRSRGTEFRAVIYALDPGRHGHPMRDASGRPRQLRAQTSAVALDLAREFLRTRYRTAIVSTKACAPSLR